MNRKLTCLIAMFFMAVFSLPALAQLEELNLKAVYI